MTTTVKNFRVSGFINKIYVTKIISSTDSCILEDAHNAGIMIITSYEKIPVNT